MSLLPPAETYRIKWKTKVGIMGTAEISLDIRPVGAVPEGQRATVRDLVQGLRALGREVTVVIPERQVEIETVVDVEML